MTFFLLLATLLARLPTGMFVLQLAYDLTVHKLVPVL